MNLQTFKFPVSSIRCQRGDYILQRTVDDRIKVYSVQDLVKLSRLVRFGEDELVDEEAILDSERPAFKDEIYLLLTAFERSFASVDEATRAVRTNELGLATDGVCLNISRFPTSSTHVVHDAGRQQS